MRLIKHKCGPAISRGLYYQNIRYTLEAYTTNFTFIASLNLDTALMASSNLTSQSIKYLLSFIKGGIFNAKNLTRSGTRCIDRGKVACCCFDYRAYNRLGAMLAQALVKELQTK